MSRVRLSWFGLAVSVAIAAAIFSGAAEAIAADKVVLKYGLLRASVSVDDLAELAETGEASRSLQFYLRLANKDPEELQRILNQEVRVDGAFLSRLLNSFPGELLLDQIGEVIHTPSGRANRQAMRSAIVTSALPDNTVTLLEILQNYPTSELHVEGKRIAEIVEKIDRIAGQLPEWLF